MLYSAAYRILGWYRKSPYILSCRGILSALTLCYSAFLTTADVPKVYMHNHYVVYLPQKTSFRSVLEFMVKTLMNFPMMKILCLSSKNWSTLGNSVQFTVVVVD
ncbi:hypothetical protein Tco_0578603 [Tanacetum coccineum]